jgi:uncharacterized protein YebE (UPF0316 family)
MNTLLLTFIILNILNVIIQTVKSIATVKCGKTAAAIINAVAYGLYTVVTVYMMCELELWLKALIVAVANLIGVYVVKFLEEKARKDKLWLVKITIPKEKTEQVKSFLEKENIPFSYYNITKYFVFDTYCENQNQTKKVLNICKFCNGKAFATENKLGL